MAPGWDRDSEGPTLEVEPHESRWIRGHFASFDDDPTTPGTYDRGFERFVDDGDIPTRPADLSLPLPIVDEDGDPTEPVRWFPESTPARVEPIAREPRPSPEWAPHLAAHRSPVVPAQRFVTSDVDAPVRGGIKPRPEPGASRPLGGRSLRPKTQLTEMESRRPFEPPTDDAPIGQRQITHYDDRDGAMPYHHTPAASLPRGAGAPLPAGMAGAPAPARVPVTSADMIGGPAPDVPTRPPVPPTPPPEITGRSRPNSGGLKARTIKPLAEEIAPEHHITRSRGPRQAPELPAREGRSDPAPRRRTASPPARRSDRVYPWLMVLAVVFGLSIGVLSGMIYLTR